MKLVRKRKGRGVKKENEQDLEKDEGKNGRRGREGKTESEWERVKV
jgi:hypothetical protein